MRATSWNLKVDRNKARYTSAPAYYQTMLPRKQERCPSLQAALGEAVGTRQSQPFPRMLKRRWQAWVPVWSLLLSCCVSFCLSICRMGSPSAPCHLPLRSLGAFRIWWLGRLQPMPAVPWFSPPGASVSLLMKWAHDAYSSRAAV